MTYSNFNRDDVLVAQEILYRLREGFIDWKYIENEESLYFINLEDITHIDISLSKYPATVHVNWDLYKQQMHFPHITVHNHPIGKPIPSKGDWGFAEYIENLIQDCKFHMIVTPKYHRACIFQYGKGVLHFF